jgi:prephenate dehydrogenase
MNPTICIIGAKGKMGSAFTQLFTSKGIQVLEVDIGSTLTAQEAIPQADITIFSVPITNTVDLINELSIMAKSGSLVADFTSIKSPAVEAMKENAPEDCEIMGIHPMFGPSVVKQLKDQVIAFSPIRSGTWSQWLLDFFKEEGALLKETTAQHHDEMMSVIQGIIHFSSIATGIAIKNLGFNFQETLAFSSPVYRLRLDMCGRVLSQSARLYGEIALENPMNKKSVKAYQDAIALIADSINNHDIDEFTSAFEEAAEFLGEDFVNAAYQRTNQLIQKSKDIL